MQSFYGSVMLSMTLGDHSKQLQLLQEPDNRWHTIPLW